MQSVSLKSAHAGLESLVMNWLFKEEPSNYSYDDLARDGRTSWTGVRNPVAQRHLRSVKKGYKIFVYPTGDEKAVVGICRAAGDAYADPADKTGKLYAVDVEPVKSEIEPSGFTRSRRSAVETGAAESGDHGRGGEDACQVRYPTAVRCPLSLS